MASVLLFSLMRHHHFKVQSPISGNWNLTKMHHTSGFPSSLCSLISPAHRLLVYTAVSPFLLPLPFFLSSTFFFLAPSLSRSVSLSLCDLLAMNQGWGSMPEERWEHSGKWLFPARLHHIRMGNGRKKSVCVCMCVCVSPLSDQLGMSWVSTMASWNLLIVFKWKQNLSLYTQKNPAYIALMENLNCSFTSYVNSIE